VNQTGTAFTEVGIKVIAENIQTHEAGHVNSCFFTMVAVDDHRNPVAVTPIKTSIKIKKTALACGPEMNSYFKNELFAKWIRTWGDV
jgi:acyl-CoA hydrolase